MSGSVEVQAIPSIQVQCVDPDDEDLGGRHVSHVSTGARRTSIHLSDRQMLRATTPAVLLAGIGRRMRKSVGGIGEVAESADDAYRKSFPVDELDIFLSHSWHTWWLLKYLTLLYYFNAVPAVLTASFAGMVYMLGTYRADREGHDYEPDLRDVRPNAQVIGTVVFFTTLLSWHHILRRLSMAPTMFLDKVCIHQTDAALKVKGIKSIGAILANSKLMLVTWDSTYFERLWCTYEMSAFRKGNPNGRIKVLPVVLGPFVLSYHLATWISDVALQGVELMEKRKWGGDLFRLSALIHLPSFILCMRVMARYINNLRKLKMQLATFSVRSAKCFCCDAKHIHPDTGATLPCDREVVNNSIENWMGLDTFDRMVRGDFKRFVKRTLGGRARVPYRFAVAASIYPGFSIMDHLVAKQKRRWYVEVVCVLEATYLRHPLLIALIVTFLCQYQNRLQELLMDLLKLVMTDLAMADTVGKWTLYTITGVLLTALYYALLHIASKAFAPGNEIFMVLWLLAELFCILSLYFGSIFYFWTGAMRGALWNNEIYFGNEGNNSSGSPARESAMQYSRSTAVHSSRSTHLVEMSQMNRGSEFSGGSSRPMMAATSSRFSQW